MPSVLINNAGVLKPDGIDSFENGYDDISFQLEINTVGPLRITNALRPKLKGESICMLLACVCVWGGGDLPFVRRPSHHHETPRLAATDGSIVAITSSALGSMAVSGSVGTTHAFPGG